MRATTRTTLSLHGALTIPIGIANATGDKNVKLDTALPDGVKRQQVYVDPRDWAFGADDDGTALMAPRPPVRVLDHDDEEMPAGRVLTDDDVRHGIYVGDEFRPIPDTEVEAIRDDTALEEVVLLEFVDYRRVPTDRLFGSFYVQPDQGFAKAMATLMEAMRKTQKAMVVKFALRGRQRLGVIRVRRTSAGDVMLLNGVVFADQWREPDDAVLAPSQAQADERGVAAAVSVIEDFEGDGSSFDTAVDELPEQMSRLLERAVEGEFREGAEAVPDRAEAQESTPARA